MASPIWKISYGSVTQSCSDWGVSRVVLSRRSLDVDTLTFRVEAADIFSAAPFAYGQPLVLWRDSTRRFSGLITSISSHAEGEGAEAWTVTVSNAWWQLQRIIYRKPNVVKVGALLTVAMSTRVILGQDAWGHKITTDEQISLISQYALLQQSGMYVLTSLGSLVTPVMGEARDISCAAAILRMVEWTPDAAGWFDYSSATPTLQIVRFSGLSSVTLDLALASQVRGLSSLRARPDLRPAGVVFTYVGGSRDPDTGELIPTETLDSAGAASGPGVIFATLQLAATGSDNPEPAPVGLASAYYAALNRTSWEGSLTCQERECSGFARPGQILHLTNGHPDWATMSAVIQAVTEDIDSGTTTLELGLPGYLSAEDFRDLMTKTRDKPPVSDFVLSNNNGTAGVSDGAVTPGVDGIGGPAPGAGAGTPNPNAGKTPLPGQFPFITTQYCDINVTPHVTRTGRLVGVFISTP